MKPGLILLVLLAPMASATVLEFNEGHHVGDVFAAGELAAVAYYDDQGLASLQVSVPVLWLNWSRVDHYVDAAGTTASSPSTHDGAVYHNAVVHASARDQLAYLGLHGRGATATYTTSSATSNVPAFSRYSDASFVEMAEEYSTPVAAAVELDLDAGQIEVRGDHVLTLWGWTLIVEADEGRFEFWTGYNASSVGGPLHEGPAAQAHLVVTGGHSLVEAHEEGLRLWLNAAAVDSDHVELHADLDDYHPVVLDQVVRSRVEFLDHDENLVADITELPSPRAPESEGVIIAVHAPSLPGWAWALILGGVSVFVVVRQARGWPSQWFLDRAARWHAHGAYTRACIVAGVGHLLNPRQAGHRYLRGVCHVDQDHWRRALRDLEWSARHVGGLTRARALLHAAGAAAHLDQAKHASQLVTMAYREDPGVLSLLDQSVSLARLADHPSFQDAVRQCLGLGDFLAP